jgi:hypothetical protein
MINKKTTLHFPWEQILKLLNKASLSSTIVIFQIKLVLSNVHIKVALFSNSRFCGPAVPVDITEWIHKNIKVRTSPIFCVWVIVYGFF